MGGIVVRTRDREDGQGKGSERENSGVRPHIELGRVPGRTLVAKVYGVSGVGAA